MNAVYRFAIEDEYDRAALERLFLQHNFSYERIEEELTLQEAVGAFGGLIAYITLRDAVARYGTVPGRKVDGRWRVTASAIRDALAAGRLKPREATREELLERADRLTGYGAHEPVGQ